MIYDESPPFNAKGCLSIEKHWLLRLKANVVVFIAGHTNNLLGGKRADVHGRCYSYAYKKYGHYQMVCEYLYGNSWHVRLLPYNKLWS